MRIIWIAACVAGLCLPSAFAQQVLRKDPAVYTGRDRTSRVEVRAPGIRLGLRKPREVALAPLSEAEVALLTGPAARPPAGSFQLFDDAPVFGNAGFQRRSAAPAPFSEPAFVV